MRRLISFAIIKYLVHRDWFIEKDTKRSSTGKSLSEALIFTSTNPHYEDRLFIELQVQYMNIPSSGHGENMLCTKIVFDIQNNFCTQHVLPMFSKKKSFWQRFTCTKVTKVRLTYSWSLIEVQFLPIYR